MTTPEATPVDTREMYLIHTLFRREFAALPALVRAVAAGDKDRAGLIADHIEVLGETLHHHHHTEDEHLWPKLLDRCPAELSPLVDTMEEQHGGIERAGAATQQALNVWRDDPAGESGEALAGALDRLVVVLNEHMHQEEERLLPLIGRYLTTAEWEAMLAAARSGVRPERAPLVFGMLMYEGDPELIAEVFAQMPPEVRTAMRELAPRAFAERAVLLHGTATPSRAAA